jgi:glycerol-1-phosphate dehydrogenase [NAD(P)+]
VNAIFGQTLECECGRTHRIEPRRVLYAHDALRRLAAVCDEVEPTGPIAVVSDTRTLRAAGAEAAAHLRQAGRSVREVVVPDPPDGPTPVCDEPTKRFVAEGAGGARLVVTVGSGVVSDLGKWVAFEAGLPQVAFATAASMNGYASAGVAPTIGGVKTLIDARPPVAVLADPAVLKAAPHEMTAAGLGDAIAKTVSSADWRINHLVFGEYYCPRAVGLMADAEPLYMDHPAALRAGDEAALAALFEALLLSGVAMTMAGTSAPASGGEHLVSHTLDMMSALDGRPHDLHGRQVGMGTILAAALYERIMAIESPQVHAPPAEVDTAFWGPLAAVVAKHFADKQPRLARAAEWLAAGGNWDLLRNSIAPMLAAPRRVRDCLAAAGAACRAEDIGCDHARLLAAFRHAHEIRARFTVLDLAHLLGVLPAAAAEIVAAWA